MAEETLDTNRSSNEARPPTRIPTRKPKPTPAGKVGRMVAAGGAVGAGVALVGAMAAAANQAEADQAAESAQLQPVIQRVVVPQPLATTQSQPQQIVIVLPDRVAAGLSQQMPQVEPAIRAPEVVTAPPRPVAPEPAPTPVVPVTESSGS